ncbi:hypothetical protein EC9_09060 [Rosistilla ulvae]|uniref:Uncharacterized protein n=1 Tax=Rosistilla ulvae TaxID=1930277 RepID=A0A517LVT6_9BACT|nr:hypothetical protein EC9_09060 [Rosistilla ulvae]
MSVHGNVKSPALPSSWRRRLSAMDANNGESLRSAAGDRSQSDHSVEFYGCRTAGFVRRCGWRSSVAPHGGLSTEIARWDTT